jgi:NAD-dependent SIR2 family protein deacetylase
LSECKKCGAEEVPVCPDCGQPVVVYSRPCGYLRPTVCWNDGKVQEFKDRLEYESWGGDDIVGERYKSDFTDKAAKETQ